MKKNQLFVGGLLVLCGFSSLAMNNHDSIAELKRVSDGRSFIAQRCEENFTKEEKVLFSNAVKRYQNENLNNLNSTPY